MIIVRRVPLEFPANLDPMIIEGSPEESYTNIGLSYLLPYLEPYLIRSMRSAKKVVTDEKLLADLDAFNAQEGQHYRQHIRFNESVKVACPDTLKALEEELDADYTRFTKTKSLRWNLAYAEGFEALTAAMALFSFEQRVFDRMCPPARELFAWHLVEELEHRTVAFDVYKVVSGAYFYRVAISMFAQWHLCRFAIRVAKALENADPEHRAKWGGFFAALRRQRSLLWQMAKGLLPKALWTYSPFYSPHKISLPEGVQKMADHYADLSDQTRLKAEPA